jgi:arginase family enzyme
MSASVVVLACRTSDREPGAARGAEALAPRIAGRLGVGVRTVGTPGVPRTAGWREDLRDSRGCLLEAGGQVDDALVAGSFPVLCAGDCSISATTLAAVARHEPDVRVLWLDAHGDFNTPETTPSGFLGGMCLAAACGRWDAGLGADPVDPARVITCGVRDVDAGEGVELARAGVVRAERPSQVPELVRGERIYVHLDCDVLDPEVLPAQFPVPGGLSAPGLRALLTETAQAAEAIVGVEITAFAPPPEATGALAELVAAAVAPLLPREG